MNIVHHIAKNIKRSQRPQQSANIPVILLLMKVTERRLLSFIGREIAKKETCLYFNRVKILKDGNGVAEKTKKFSDQPDELTVPHF